MIKTLSETILVQQAQKARDLMQTIMKKSRKENNKGLKVHMVIT